MKNCGCIILSDDERRVMKGDVGSAIFAQSERSYRKQYNSPNIVSSMIQTERPQSFQHPWAIKIPTIIFSDSLLCSASGTNDTRTIRYFFLHALPNSRYTPLHLASHLYINAIRESLLSTSR